MLSDSDQWPVHVLARGAHCGELAGVEEASLVASKHLSGVSVVVLCSGTSFGRLEV